MRPFPRQEVPHIGKNKARAGESRYREMIIFRISLVKKREGERKRDILRCQLAKALLYVVRDPMAYAILCHGIQVVF